MIETKKGINLMMFIFSIFYLIVIINPNSFSFIISQFLLFFFSAMNPVAGLSSWIVTLPFYPYIDSKIILGVPLISISTSVFLAGFIFNSIVRKKQFYYSIKGILFVYLMVLVSLIPLSLHSFDNKTILTYLLFCVFLLFFLFVTSHLKRDIGVIWSIFNALLVSITMLIIFFASTDPGIVVGNIRRLTLDGNVRYMTNGIGLCIIILIYCLIDFDNINLEHKNQMFVKRKLLLLIILLFISIFFTD